MVDSKHRYCRCFFIFFRASKNDFRASRCWLKLAQRASCKINFLCTLTYLYVKIRNRLLPHNILELFLPSPFNYNLGNSDFHVQRVKTVKYGKHSLGFFGPFLWSKLSMKDRNETSLRRFKTNIRRKDLSKLLRDDVCKGCHLCDS